MYVDDLNTDERYRSKGYGKVLLDWLKTEEPSHKVADNYILIQGFSGEQKNHRFYFREGLTINCHHFHDDALT